MINHQIFRYDIENRLTTTMISWLMIPSKTIVLSITIPLTNYLMVTQTNQTKLTTRFVLPLTLIIIIVIIVWDFIFFYLITNPFC